MLSLPLELTEPATELVSISSTGGNAEALPVFLWRIGGLSDTLPFCLPTLAGGLCFFDGLTRLPLETTSCSSGEDGRWLRLRFPEERFGGGSPEIIYVPESPCQQYTGYDIIFINGFLSRVQRLYRCDYRKK